MADQVTIVNRALTTLGAEPIVNLTDNTLEAKVANRVYDESRKSILSERLWTFATKRALLNQVTTPLAWTDINFNFLYQLPSDIIRIFGINSDRAEWRVEQEYITSDTDGLGIIYVFNQTDTTKWGASFVDAFADKLAADMSFSINNSKSSTKDILSKYEGETLPKAMSEDSQGAGTPLQVDDNLWVYAKYGFTPVDARGRRIA
jgi:hypothetical protein